MCICDLIRSLGTHMAKHFQSKCTRRDEKSTLGVRSAAEQSRAIQSWDVFWALRKMGGARVYDAIRMERLKYEMCWS